MSSEVSITLTGDAARLVGELQRVVGKFSELEGGAKGVAEAYKADARAARDLERDAKRAWESTRTPQEQHIERIRRAEQFIGKAGFTQKDYARYVKQSEERMRDLENASEGAFTSGGKIAGLAGRFISVGAAIAAIATAIRDADAAAEDAARRQVESRIGIGSLAQVATSTEDFQRLKAKAEGVYKAGAAGSMDEAAQLVFALRSAGQDESIGLLTQLRATGVVADPAAMVKAITTLQTSMGTEETGGMRDMISKAFGASAFSPATAEALLEASSRAGTGAKAMGLTDEEILAATAVTATATGSAERGGTQVASLLRSIEKIGAAGSGDKSAIAAAFGGEDEGAIAGLSTAIEEAGIKFDKTDNLMQRVEKIQAAGLGNAEMMKLFGREEAIDAFRTLVLQKDLYGRALAGTQAAQASDVVGERLRMVESDPTLAAARLAAEQKAVVQMSEERRGMDRNMTNALMDRSAKEQRDTGAAEFPLFLQRKISEFRRMMYGDRYMLEEAESRGMFDAGGQLPGDLRDKYKSYLQQDRPVGMNAEVGQELQKGSRELSNAASKLGFGPDRALSKPDIDR